MGQILHGSVKTTEATRRAMQNSQESLVVLATRYALTLKTVSKWKKRNFVHDASIDPKEIRSTVLLLDRSRFVAALLTAYNALKEKINGFDRCNAIKTGSGACRTY